MNGIYHSWHFSTAREFRRNLESSECKARQFWIANTKTTRQRENIPKCACTSDGFWAHGDLVALHRGMTSSPISEQLSHRPQIKPLKRHEQSKVKTRRQIHVTAFGGRRTKRPPILRLNARKKNQVVYSMVLDVDSSSVSCVSTPANEHQKPFQVHARMLVEKPDLRTTDTGLGLSLMPIRNHARKKN